MKRQRGLTLLEMVITLVIVGLLGAGVALLLARPLQAYLALEQRTDLIHEADLTMSRLREELRLALPNSVRTGCDDHCLEFMTVVAGRFVRLVRNDPGDTDFTLNLNREDGVFHLLAAHMRTRDGAELAQGNPLPAGYRLAFSPQNGNPGNLYRDFADNVSRGSITATTTTITPTLHSGPGGNGNGDNIEVRISLAPPHSFSAPGNDNFLYLVEGPVLYFCDPNTRTLTVHRHYTPGFHPPTTPPDNGSVLSNRVVDCLFTKSNGNQKDLFALELSFRDSGQPATTVRLYETLLVEPPP